MPEVVPLGDRALLARFAFESEAAAWASTVRSQNWPGIIDIVPAYRTVGVFPDPGVVDWDGLTGRLRSLEASASEATAGRRIELPVLYDGTDLAEVARQKGLSEEQVVAAHSGRDYTVFAVGFLPGFPYAGDLPDVLTGLPRWPSPRTRVPAGSVAIAGSQTGVYPSDSPGGWHLLGRTPLRIADLARGHFPIRPGDRLCFVPISPAEYEQRRGEPVT